MRQAFTLFELLVVITIIAILASLVLPAAKVVRDSARSLKCVSNVRQIGMALSSYLDDNDMNFPPMRVDPPVTTALYGTAAIYGAVYWPAEPIVGKYLDKAELNWVTSTNRVWRCPSDRRPSSWSQWANSYGINGNLASPITTWKSSILKVSRISQTMLVTDTEDPRWGAGSLAIGQLPDNSGAWSGFNWVKRHNGGASVLYCDLHAVHSADLQHDVAVKDAYTQ